MGTAPSGIAVTPDGSRVYVANDASDNVSVIDTSTNTVIATITAPANSQEIAISPNGLFAYLTNENNATVSIINTSNNTITGTIPVGMGPTGVAFTTDGSLAYVANATSANVSVINTSTSLVTATVTAGTTPQFVALTPSPPSPPPPPSSAPLPPQCINGNQKNNRFATQSELYNTINWCASPSTGVVKYNVYRNGALIGSVVSNTFLTFEDHDRPKGEKDLYAVTAVNSSGSESTTLTITPP